MAKSGAFLPKSARASRKRSVAKSASVSGLEKSLRGGVGEREAALQLTELFLKRT